MWSGGSVIEFQLCILWLLVRSPVGGDHSIHCWWDLIRSKQLSSGSVCHAQVFGRFFGHGNSIHKIIPLLEKENIHLQWGISLLLIFKRRTSDKKKSTLSLLYENSSQSPQESLAGLHTWKRGICSSYVDQVKCVLAVGQGHLTRFPRSQHSCNTY